MLKQYLDETKIEVGIDEAGRGCLSGPVTAAAVILKPGFTHEEINSFHIYIVPHLQLW